MQYIHSLPAWPSFKDRGLSGYAFGPLKQKDLDIYYVEVESGHDTFMVSRKITRTYYVLCGSGYFTIEGRTYDVGPGMLVEVPPRVEYSYSGKMRLLIFSRPRWFVGNDRFTRWNRDVIDSDLAPPPQNRLWLARLIQLRLFGNSPVGAYLQVNQKLWNNLPLQVTSWAVIKAYGEFLHKLARASGTRAQACSTFFLRNRPLLELIQRLAQRSQKKDVLKVAVLGCSTGAEVYSVAWKIRTACPDIKLTLHAIDISGQAIEIAEKAVYSLGPGKAGEASIFERLSKYEIGEMFEQDGDNLTVRTWLREGIKWHVADVGDSGIEDVLGPYDLVLANNFLCHMENSVAERYLRNISQLLVPGGHLLLCGVDLDVRTKVANDLRWNPLQELLEDIHEGDPCLRHLWPCHYAGLEPLDKARSDWRHRYAVAFKVGVPAKANRDFGADEFVISA